MRILLLSAYDAASHQRWHTQLTQRLPHFDWTVLALPPRFFSWRIKGNPLSWAFSEQERLSQHYDCVLATSMVDLTVLRGLIPSLAQIPTIVYFHENQFAYPLQDPSLLRESVHFCLHNLYNALCADHVVFNSEYNQETFLRGADALLNKMPDQVPKGIISSIEQKAKCLPVPLEPEWFQPRQQATQGPLQIVWNHRWEHDKAPERLFHVLYQLDEEGLPFRLHILGQSFRSQPPIFAQAKARLAKHIESWGFEPSRERYTERLRSADLAVSTALHDFQGLSLLEAVAAGCLPLVPGRLAYPQWIPAQHQYDSYVEEAKREEQALLSRLRVYAQQPTLAREQEPVDLRGLSWERWLPSYEALLQSAANQP